MRICKVVRCCCCCCCCSNKKEARQKQKHVGVGTLQHQVVEMKEIEMEESKPGGEDDETFDTTEFPVSNIQVRKREIVEVQQVRQVRVVEVQEVQVQIDAEDADEEEGVDEISEFPDSGSVYVNGLEVIEEEECEECHEDQRPLNDPDSYSEHILRKFRKEIKGAILKEVNLEEGQSPDFIVVGYMSKFVAGMDFYLKILERVSGHYFHLRVYESLQGDLMLQRLSAPKRFEDPILYF